MDIDIKVLIPIVSAATSILVAILAWLQSSKNAAITAKTAMELEHIKTTNSLKLKALELAASSIGPIDKALADAWQDIQRIKEQISMLTGAGSYELCRVREAIEHAKNSLVNGYAAFGSALPHPGRLAWHNAKGRAITLLAHLEEISVNDEYLQRSREDLSDYQAIIGGGEYVKTTCWRHSLLS